MKGNEYQQVPMNTKIPGQRPFLDFLKATENVLMASLLQHD
jgi:hypothetical protein